MSSRTSIEWAANRDGTPGATWNPIRALYRLDGIDHEPTLHMVGFHCVHVSEGCRNCYAERLNMSPRFPGHGTGLPYAKQSEAKVHVFLDEERLAIPLRRRKPTTYFLSSMTDVFADFVSNDMLDRLFAVMAISPQHTFIVLTKRADRMREFVSTHTRQSMNAKIYSFLGSPIGSKVKHGGEWRKPWPLPNVWLGVSVEDQATADERIPHLLATPAAIRCLSAEPLLGSLKLNRLNIRPPFGARGWYDALSEWREIVGERDQDVEGALDWIICGGESGPNARPMHPDWARSLRDQCAAAGVPFFFKQWGEWIPLEVSGRDAFWPTDAKSALRLNADGSRGPDGWPLQRVGKARAGRLLDGMEHNGRPQL